MTDLAAVLTEMRRPRILIRAARAGVADYRRERDLKRLIPADDRAALPHQLAALLAEELRLEEARLAGLAAGYRVHRHVAVLAALLAEARLRTEVEAAHAIELAA